MIDELDLAFDEHAEKGRPRHRRGARGGKPSRGKSGIAFLMAFVLLAALAVLVSNLLGIRLPIPGYSL